MILALAIVGAAVGAAALAAGRSAAPAAPPTPPPQQPAPAQAPPRQQPVQVQPRREALDDGKGKKDGMDLGSQGGLIAAAGVAGGLLGREMAFTKDAKDVSLPIGLGVAAATYLATTVGGATVAGVTGAAVAGAAAGAYLIVPVVLITTSIIAIVDVIARAVRAGEWIELVKKVKELREQGQFREALILWREKTPDISAISRVWPKPGDDWFNAEDPLGRPWPGFPIEPAPATAFDVQRWPELVPPAVYTAAGDEIRVRPLFESLQKDVREVREWGLANKVPGKAVVGGKVITTTEGPRDLKGWKPYDVARSNLSSWAEAIARATPWLSDGALEGFALVPTIEERAVFKAQQTAVAVAAERRKIDRVAVGMGNRALAAAIVAEASAEAGATARTESRTATTEETSGRETGSRITNRSGSGGRNA